MSTTTPRVIEARYTSRCATCRGPINAGERVSYLPPEGDRHGQVTHLACASPQAAEEARYAARRSTVETTGRVPGRDPKRPCPACDNAGYACDMCGNPGLENAPGGRPLPRPPVSTAPERMGETVKASETPRPVPEHDAARQSNPAPRRGLPAAGFPVRRDARARHASVSEAEAAAKPKPVGNPDLPHDALTGRIKPYVYIDGCLTCADRAGPSHTGSTLCRSGSLASGGLRAHCSCDTCW